MNFIQQFLIERGVSKSIALWIDENTSILIILILAFITYKVAKRFIIKSLKWFSNSSKTDFDDILIKTKFPNYVAHIPTYIVLIIAFKGILNGLPEIKNTFIKIADIYLIFLIAQILVSIIKTTRIFLKSKNSYRDKPVDSLSQVFILIIWGLGLLAMLSYITDKSIMTFLTALGAASAVILLIFRDTILGFVASIQVSVNNIVRIGDWVTQEKYGADGDVIEINLTTVKVKNFDNTTTTIPTYSLISDSFKNWRGMQESGGRRIKRSVLIKQSSVKFLNKEDIEQLSKIQLIKEYLIERQKEIENHNSKHNHDNDSSPVNGRNLTNLGVFRQYCDIYMSNHQAVNPNLKIMTRHLQPTDKGIPLEIYAFSKNKNWVAYEKIQAGIFEHIIASIPYFELEIYESLSKIKETNSSS